MTDNEIKQAALKIACDLLTEAVNGDGLPLLQYPYGHQRRIANKVIEVIDQLWTEYHALDPAGAMNIVLPDYWTETR